jgi:hypothetical protein
MSRGCRQGAVISTKERRSDRRKTEGPRAKAPSGATEKTITLLFEGCVSGSPPIDENPPVLSRRHILASHFREFSPNCNGIRLSDINYQSRFLKPPGPAVAVRAASD